ncbi:MAG: NADH-quinone oxidoreductase subunit NuoF, partial [Candidatus Eremiobacterota bacterium]
IQREHNNYLSSEAIKDVAHYLETTESRVFGVASYYTMFNLKPVGTYHLQVDVNVPGFLTGADDILKHLEKKLAIKAGQTTSDGLFTLTKVQDLGSCGTCPVIQVNDIYYEHMTLEKTDMLIDSLCKGTMPEPDKSSFYFSECNILLKNLGRENSRHIKTYKENGGYKALEKAMSMKPSDIISTVKEAMVRGRGGAGFPAGLKWSFLPKNDRRPVYLICNADEGEPGTFKDRQIMEYDPHLLIEGIAISAYGTGAKKAFIYIRGEFRWIAEVLEEAIKEAEKEGYLHYTDIIVYKGAGSYVCGDETALMESLEGKRGYPRRKPPFPAGKGLYGCPTIINNVETLAIIPFIIEHGAEEFRKIGTAGNFGPKLYGVSGHINRPGMYEFPLGTVLEKILDAAGGVKGKLKAVIVGGLSVPILRADEIRGLKMDYDSCLKAGTMLGSGGIMVINDTVSIPELALRTIEFYAHESCGQCVPCREGSYAIKDLLGKILHKKGTDADIELVLKLCRNIKGRTICPTGDAFSMPVEAMILKFRNEFDSLVSREW